MRYKVLWIFIVLAFAKAEYTIAQSTQKIEREEKISKALFPKNAITFVETIGNSRKKVNFYRETDGDKISYEAKLKYQNRKYSIEFDANGTLEDVEIDVRKRKINKASFAQIEQYLDTIARKYRIEKVQEQYVGKNKTAPQIADKIAQKSVDNYEIIVAFKNNRKIYRREYLFDKNGNFISKRDIKRQEYDFILF
ncbi:hypothetical protein LX97_01040 [Nonlabens dokdonensis]|jgi:hypothetical protein|uniref:Leucyl/phenylalanyl-tRNA--protein transferase n=2 Tax=Nonlabens dokdonensis TaxID=328515 RepID=L7W985_NONDD|nr:leucyl/phenylalanyl-tRNA--protein transferase [Nonlabens dokdonensis]AGC76376.1 leucyl/phenylalanyl-tRNA--protein transferase [Nonlabens dokdonensis DSW-6]PZX44034.1 hypothetical protein LX97_01040 [Nonlabens dokdonensis]